MEGLNCGREQQHRKPSCVFQWKTFIVDPRFWILVETPMLGPESKVPDAEKRAKVFVTVLRFDGVVDTMGLRRNEYVLKRPQIGLDVAVVKSGVPAYEKDERDDCGCLEL